MIYIVNHQPGTPAEVPGYQNLYVGKVGHGKINHLNPYINEATGLYEIWKKQDDYKGLVHYRRLFIEGGGLLTLTRAKEILEDYDVITTVDFEPETPYKLLEYNLGKVIDKYIDQLPKEVRLWFMTHSAYNICNMFVSRADFIDAYCEWLFPMILPLAEQFVKEDVSEDYKHNRAIGFIIECLFGYYCTQYKRYKMEIKTL